MKQVDYDVEVRELPARPVATIRVSTTADRIAESFREVLPEVLAHIQGAGAQPMQPPLAIFHGYDDRAVDMEAGFAVSEPISSGGRVEVRELPAGRAAVTWHHGPYSRLGEAHRAVADWIAAEGHEQTGPPWELYWSDPADTRAAELRTEVGYPIA